MVLYTKCAAPASAEPGCRIIFRGHDMGVLQTVGCAGLCKIRSLGFQFFPQDPGMADGRGSPGFCSLLTEEEQSVRVEWGLRHLMVEWNEGFRRGLIGCKDTFGPVDPHSVGKGFFIGKVGEVKGLHEGIKVEVCPQWQPANEKGAVIPGQSEEFILFRLDLRAGCLH